MLWSSGLTEFMRARSCNLSTHASTKLNVVGSIFASVNVFYGQYAQWPRKNTHGHREWMLTRRLLCKYSAPSGCTYVCQSALNQRHDLHISSSPFTHWLTHSPVGKVSHDCWNSVILGNKTFISGGRLLKTINRYTECCSYIRKMTLVVSWIIDCTDRRKVDRSTRTTGRDGVVNFCM